MVAAHSEADRMGPRSRRSDRVQQREALRTFTELRLRDDESVISPGKMYKLRAEAQTYRSWRTFSRIDSETSTSGESIHCQPQENLGLSDWIIWQSRFIQHNRLRFSRSVSAARRTSLIACIICSKRSHQPVNSPNPDKTAKGKSAVRQTSPNVVKL